VILVTGGTGFVGPKVIHALRAEDRPVRALVRNPSGESARTLVAWGCEVARGDMTDPESLNRAVAGCDTVVHLVAIVRGRPQDFERIMSQGTRDLITAAKNAGVTRFVHQSALGTGERSKDLTAYFRAKWEMEKAVEASGFEYTIFRPSFVFGRNGGMLPIFIRSVRWSPVVPIVGTRRLQPIWVEDVAAYFAKALSLDGGAANRTFELGGPEAVTWDEVYDRIKRCLGTRRPTFHMPIGLARAGAAVVENLPGSFPLSRDALTMLEFEDNVCDIGPAVETFGIEPIGLQEQIRRAV
jgi:uncharacterized protein YbjT (DUF2867 family)